MGNARSGLRVNLRRHHERRVDERLGDALLHLGELPRSRRRSGYRRRARASLRPRRSALREVASGVSAMRTCDTTAPFFCARPGHVEHAADALPSRCAAMPSSAPIVTTPVPPMPVTTNAVGFAASPGARARASARNSAGLGLFRLAQLTAFDRDEARAKAVHARVILVARRLVDRALAAELGFHRRDRHAVRLDRRSRRSLRRRASLMTTRRAGSGTCRASCGGAFRPRTSGRRAGSCSPSVSRSCRWTASRSSRWWISMSLAK